MKRTIHISLPLVTAVAASLGLSGCEQRDQWEAQGASRVCTDANGTRIMDAECERPANGGHAHWYYFAGGLAVAHYGQRVFGGSYQPSPGVAYHAPTKVSRGGFGSAGRGFSMGG